MYSKADEGHGGAFIRRPQRNCALRSQYPENRRLKVNIKEIGNVSRTRTAKAASNIETSSLNTATFTPAQVKPFGTPRFGTSHASNSWNLWAPALHCTARSHAWPSRSANQPHLHARGPESRSVVATAVRTSRNSTQELLRGVKTRRILLHA